MPGVHVTGASGSGTSTLGRALAERTNSRFLDADDVYWLATKPPYQQKRDRAGRVSLLQGAVRDAAGQIVLSGSIVHWGDDVADACDLIVFLTVPTPIRLARLRERERRELGAIDESFLTWAAKYDDGGLDVRSRALHEEWLAQRRAPILRIDGTPSVDDSLDIVLTELAQLRA